MPLLSRACMVGMSSKPRPAAPSNEQICIDQYEECVALCESGTDTETDTGSETDTDTGGESECEQICDEELLNCFEFGAPTQPDHYDHGTEQPTCDPQEGYCGYAEDYDYGQPVEEYPSEDSYDWSCDSSDDSYYDDSSSDWSCDYSDDDYSDDYSSDDGGWDCSADNYDEGDSDSDGDWGEDWGERSPAGGDGIEAPSDLPPE